MGNSLLEIKPHQVSRDLRGYSVLLYDSPKSGKTTVASHFPGALLCAFEKGYNAIPGIMAKPINSWGEFKKTIRELQDPKVKDLFQTIVIDTADIAYSYCEKYVCAQHSDMNKTYESIDDFGYGKGYKLVATEFDDCIRKILQMDYGLVLISHAQDKTFKDESGNDVNQIIPTLENKARLICERTCDIIGYSRVVDNPETGEKKTMLFMRGTPRYIAGSRFKYTPDYIEFNYDNLVKAIADAIDKEAAEKGSSAVTSERNQVVTKDIVYDFPAMMDEFQTLAGQLVNQDKSALITKVVEEHLGAGKKVGTCTEAQAPQLEMILYDLKLLLD
jgi:hypothetical protein